MRAGARSLAHQKTSTYALLGFSYLPDQSEPTELSLKGGPDSKNYILPAEAPAGSARDREIVSFDGRVLITRFTDPEVSGRYGAKHRRAV
jgi:hypothetical protein